MYCIFLIDSYGYHFDAVFGEFDSIEDAIKCLVMNTSDLEKLTDTTYLDGHDLYTIYRRD
jgi:hypothetical protein